MKWIRLDFGLKREVNWRYLESESMATESCCDVAWGVEGVDCLSAQVFADVYREISEISRECQQCQQCELEMLRGLIFVAGGGQKLGNSETATQF